jgi:hypothetical protein
MKPLKLILMLLCSHLTAREVKVHVIDENGSPVAGAKSSIYFVNARHDERRDGVTDINGVSSANGSGTNSFGFIITKHGHYQARVEGLSKDEDHDVEVVLPRILNPIPLYAQHGGSATAIAFPVQNEWVGFDLEVADWVAPHGKGKTADFLLRFKNEFKGWRNGLEDDIDAHIAATKESALLRKEEWTMEKFKINAGRWEGVMELSFPGEGEGLFEEKRFLAYCPLKLPHLAPEEGYVPTRSFVVNGNFSPGREDIGLFLRTRVRRDKQGKMISANYAKVIGDFRVSTPGPGGFSLAYYFNPAPNDRNLEFDSDKNLFPKEKPGTNVYDP